MLPGGALGLGDVTVVHELPSQCSISVWVWIPSEVRVEPTAQQSDADVHVTPRRSPAPVDELTIDHEVPSQRSIRPFWEPKFHESPIAQHSDAEAHVTP